MSSWELRFQPLLCAIAQVCSRPSALLASGLEVDEAIVRAAAVCLISDPSANADRLRTLVDGQYCVSSTLP